MSPSLTYPTCAKVYIVPTTFFFPSLLNFHVWRDLLLNRKSSDNPYFEGMVNRIYPPELQLNKANTSDTEVPFLDLHLSISNGFVSSKIYNKRDDFDFDIVNFPFLDGDVPRSTSYGVYISQLIRVARVSSHVVDFSACNKSLTAKLLQQGYRYHKLRKTFSKFYRRHNELVSKFNVGLKHFCIKAYRNRNFMVT